MKLVIRHEPIVENEIEHSRFIARVFRVKDETEAKEKIAQVRKMEHQATHNCYAYVISENKYKSSDDGEPSSSAGLPILKAIQTKNLVECLVVVTRYFGGVKLGVGGLIRAYGGTASLALDKAEAIQVLTLKKYAFTIDYNLNDIVANYLRKENVRVVKLDYDLKVNYEVLFRSENEVTKLKNFVNGKITFKGLGNEEVEE